MRRPQTTEPLTGDEGYPLRDEATQPWPPPPPPVDAGSEEIYTEPPPAGRRRRFMPERTPWPWLLALVILFGGLGIAYAVTRPVHQGHAGGPNPASASPPPAQPSAPPTTAATPPPAQPTQQAVAVPSVVGTPLPRAVSELRHAGLTVVVAKVSANAPQGQVVAQQPTGGAKLPEGSRVRLNVAIQTLIAVPNVTGIQGLVAVHTLKGDHLVASVRYVPSTEPARRVVSQWPAAGRKVKPGTVVRLNLSQGLRGKVSVPNVVDEDEATARSDLVSAGFKVNTVDSPTNDSSQDGMVVSQSPTGNSKATRGSTVTIHVGRYSGG